MDIEPAMRKKIGISVGVVVGFIVVFLAIGAVSGQELGAQGALYLIAALIVFIITMAVVGLLLERSD
jgi:lipopolysaccharide export LptBFGC system permease protein LptF